MKMQLFPHKKIKTFTQDMFVKESELIESQRDNLMRHMYDDMREAGYLPCMDIVNYTTERDYNTGWFKVTLSVYGVFVGKEKACRLEGIEISDSGKVYSSEYRATKANS